MRAAAIAAGVTLAIAGTGFVVSRELPARPAERIAAAPVSAERSGSDASGRDAAAESEAAPRATAGDPAAARAFHQWTDESGAVRFARSLAEVPPAWRERAGRIEVDAKALIRTDAPAARSRPSRSHAPAEAPARRAFHDVTVYTAPWCGWCRKTLAFLDARGVDYVNKDIEADPSFRDEMIQKSGRSSVPLVEIDGTLIRGYNPREMAALLE